MSSQLGDGSPSIARPGRSLDVARALPSLVVVRSPPSPGRRPLDVARQPRPSPARCCRLRAPPPDWLRSRPLSRPLYDLIFSIPSRRVRPAASTTDDLLADATPWNRNVHPSFFWPTSGAVGTPCLLAFVTRTMLQNGVRRRCQDPAICDVTATGFRIPI